MSQAFDLYERLKARVEADERPIRHMPTRESTKSFPPSSSPLASNFMCCENSQGTSGTPAPCPHVEDPELIAWHDAHPEIVCAKCWLDGRPLPSWNQETARRLLGEMFDRCEAAYDEAPEPAVFDDADVRTAERRIDRMFVRQDWHGLLRALRRYERIFEKALGRAHESGAHSPVNGAETTPTEATTTPSTVDHV